MKMQHLSKIKTRVRDIWSEQVQKRWFRISLYVLTVLIALGALVGIDYHIAIRYQRTALTQRIFGLEPTYYDNVQVSGQSIYVKGQDTDIQGTLYCYKDGEVVHVEPLSKKIDGSFNLSRVGEHTDTFTYNHKTLRYTYVVYDAYDPADGSPVSFSIQELVNVYRIGERFNTSAIIEIDLDTGKTYRMPVRESYVSNFDTSAVGTFNTEISFTIGGVTFTIPYTYTVSE